MRKTGTIASWTDAQGRLRYRARIHLRDGSRPWKTLEPDTSEDEARAIARKLQQDEDEAGTLSLAKEEAAKREAETRRASHPQESVEAWIVRYLPTTNGGTGSREQHVCNLKKWVTSKLGPKPMSALTREDVEDIVADLDKAIDDGTIRAKTASNIWSSFKLALQAAAAAKDRSLRCHPVPLYFGVLPPKRGRSRRRPWLYPNEWSQLVRCEKVPVEWLRTYTIALYTGLRPNEHRVLLGEDADLKALVVSVTKAWDVRARVVGPPKTPAAYRDIPLEPSLLPLLKVLKAPKGSAERPLSPILSTDAVKYAAVTFREHLKLAGVKRPRLFASNQTEEEIDFRSLRDTYATWLALNGMNISRIQRRMGHTSPATTDKYVKAAESFDPAAIGKPFPALPKRLV